MTIWALADLHLSFGVPNKSMDVFGDPWVGWTEKIEKNWRSKVSDEDLVLIPGDISWAKHTEDAQADLDWIDQLPGTKLLLRGNHDYWWSTMKKLRSILPKSIYLIHNDAFDWEDITIGGARLWDTYEYNFNDFIPYVENPYARELTKTEMEPGETEKIFQREINRLHLSLEKLNPKAKVRIAMTHYPPICAGLKNSRASKILEQYNIDICVFGHLHNTVPGTLPFGEKNGIKYILASGDYLNFDPIKVYEK